jgi:hypothetical protein
MKKLILALILLVFVTGKIFAQQVIPAYKNPKNTPVGELKISAKENPLLSKMAHPDSFRKIALFDTVFTSKLLNITPENLTSMTGTALLASTKTKSEKGFSIVNLIGLKTLKDSLKLTSDSTTLVSLNKQITNIKVYNTNQFLSHLRPTKPFVITDLGIYQVDSLNGYFYNQSNVSAFQSATIQNFTGSKTFISAEFASFLFGPVRMGLGGTFLSAGDTTKDNATKTSIQKIVSSGGTIDLNFAVPLFFARARNEQSHFGIAFQMNNGINPGSDTTGSISLTKNLSYTNQSGVVFHFDAGSNDGKALLSLNVSGYYGWGINSAKELGVSNYAMVKVQFGAVFSNLLSLNLSGPALCTSKALLNTPWAVSLQFSPGRAVKPN